MIDRNFWKQAKKLNQGGITIESNDGKYKLWYDESYYFYWKAGTSYSSWRQIHSLYDLDNVLAELNIGYTFGALNNRLKEVGLEIPLGHRKLVDGVLGIG